MKKFSVGPSFDLKSVVFSHGWSDLPPFYVQDTKGTVSLALPKGRGAITLKVRPIKGGFTVDGPLTKSIEEKLRWIFRLDEDYASFYSTALRARKPWIGRNFMGRLLRSETLFEDLVKYVLTTNCNWGMTRKMTDRLSVFLGRRTKEGCFTFPLAEDLARQKESFYKDEVRCGYRSGPLLEIANLVASGKWSPDILKDPERKTEDLRKEFLQLPGVGPYVAENMLKLSGRYDYLGIDSWVRASLKKKWRMQSEPTDREIKGRYKKHGEYQGLILWCDLTRDWFREGDFSTWIRVNSDSRPV